MFRGVDGKSKGMFHGRDHLNRLAHSFLGAFIVLLHALGGLAVALCLRIVLGVSVVLICLSSSAIGQYREVGNSLKMGFVLAPAGQFQMGSPANEKDSEGDESLRQVTITKPFYIGKTEVTQSQYEAVMGFNPAYFQGDVMTERDPDTGRITKEVDTSNYPVESICWDDAVEFCKRLSNRPEEMRAGRSYRLPTEAEWEYCCRAGSDRRFDFGDSEKTLMGSAWYAMNCGDRTMSPDVIAGKDRGELVRRLQEFRCRTREVATKKPNSWGIYDMHGNIWEICSDWYGPYDKGPVADPQGPPQGDYVVVRGGGWAGMASSCRCASRDMTRSDQRDWVNGFRVVMTVR